MNDIKVMNHAADNIRILAASMVEKANSGHPGGAMGGSDFINVLFSEYLVYDPADPTWTGRDRFFLDPGHMSPMLYAGLALRGFFSMEDLKQFRQWGSVTPGHPELDLQRGIPSLRRISQNRWRMPAPCQVALSVYARPTTAACRYTSTMHTPPMRLRRRSAPSWRAATAARSSSSAAAATAV